MKPALAGLWPPVATPFRADGAVDTVRLVKHSRTLLSDGALVVGSDDGKVYYFAP